MYLLDSNVFIQAKNLHYGFDFCPGFWEWIVKQNACGIVFSIEKVGNELEGIEDELSSWAANLGKNFFLPPTQPMLAALATVSAWVKNKGNFRPSAMNQFFQGADFYLIAHAVAHKLVVVTHEKASEAIRTVPIPNVCIGVNVKCMTPFEMLRHEKARFVLGNKPS